jgi:hypothetical protein
VHRASWDATGNTAGLRTRCKKGHLVVRFTQESAFEGAGVVFEAKRDASCTTQKALEELDTARATRNAGAGVFVMARSHTPDTFPIFARFRSNVLVVDRHRRVWRLGVHCVKHRLVRRVGLAHQPVDERALVVCVQRVERRRELLGSVFVGALGLVAEALEEARHSTVLGERIERANELRVAIAHYPAELDLEDLDETLAVGRAEFSDQRLHHAAFSQFGEVEVTDREARDWSPRRTPARGPRARRRTAIQYSRRWTRPWCSTHWSRPICRMSR